MEFGPIRCGAITVPFILLRDIALAKGRCGELLTLLADSNRADLVFAAIGVGLLA